MRNLDVLDDVRAKLDAGRHATAERLRRLADDLDALSLDDAAEVPSGSKTGSPSSGGDARRS